MKLILKFLDLILTVILISIISIFISNNSAKIIKGFTIEYFSLHQYIHFYNF